MVAPPTAAPNPPPLPPPGQQGPGGALPPELVAAAQAAGLPPEVYAQALVAAARAVGQDPRQLFRIIADLPPKAQRAFLTALPPDEQRTLIQNFLASQGQPGPPGVISGPVPPPDGQNAPGPPGMITPPVGAPVQPPIPLGAPSPLPGGVPNPPGTAAPPPAPRPRPQRRKTQKADIPAPKPVALPSLEAIAGASEFWKSPPKYDQVMHDGRVGPERWQHRDAHLKEVADAYALTPLGRKLDRTPLNPAAGDIDYVRSQPMTTVDRLVGLTDPTGRYVVDLPPRGEDRGSRRAAQAAEHWHRAQDLLDEESWWEVAAAGDAHSLLHHHELQLMALQTTLGWMLTVAEDDEEHPYVYTPIPPIELYPLEHATVRRTVLPLTVARARHPAVRKAFPARVDRDKEREPGPRDTDLVAIVDWSDRHGLWRATAWDFVEGSFAWTAGPQGASPPSRPTGKAGERWIMPPARLDYGFCLFQYDPPWNAAPGVPGDVERFQRLQSRTAISANLGTFENMNLVYSAALSNMLNNVNPTTVEYIDFALRAETGEGAPKTFKRGLNAHNQRGITERVEFLKNDITASKDGQFVVSGFVQEFADNAPPVLAARGQAESGFDRYLQTETAGALHVEPLMHAWAFHQQQVHRRRAELALRKKGLYSTLPIARRKGRGVAPQIKADELAKAGLRTVVTYRRTNVSEEAQRTNMYLQQLDKRVIDLERARELLGHEDPEQLERGVLRDEALDAPPVKAALIEREVYNTEDDPFIDAFERAVDPMLQQVAAAGGSPPREPGTPSAPAMPTTPNVPRAGVPASMGGP